MTPPRRPYADGARDHYDFVVCGGGTAGCVIARRLSDDPGVSVLLIEAGGSDQVPAVIDTTRWMSNIGSERDWGYRAQPSATLNGRTPVLPMGKVLGGGSSINGSIWARGHRHDYDDWAEAAGDPAWNYASVLAIYRRIEDWQGPPDAQRRGRGGLLNVEPPRDPVPLVPALIEATDALGIPAVDDINGAAMEGDGGCGLANLLVRDGNARESVAATYLHPVLGRPNLDVLLCAEVTQLLFDGAGDGLRCGGVEFVRRGRPHRVTAGREVVVSLGAINTPKLLMLSGLGDAAVLRRHGLATRRHLPAVGRHFQDHILLAGCCWTYVTPEPPRNNAAEFVFYAKSEASRRTPDLMPVLEETPFASEAVALQFDVPSGAAHAWTLAPGLARPDSRGQVRLASADWRDAPLIDANFLSEPSDVRALVRCVELCREIGNAAPVAPFRAREAFPGPLTGAALERFVRDASGTYFHQSGTARMGRDDRESVVDGQLRVHGVAGLRVADASIMPSIATGNTMAPTVVIAERAAQILHAAHGLAAPP
ncbi:GMC family oxidoreductase [Aquabacterium sp. J223]|uniref:GMC family oxidoreductase n=1 Tax=Aquabacterium sp. J223 TaxID=2898431 RepID=UPI0021ADF68B|nr:GMC family oxidoreductase N-terminal domain-containing protein [Aquabacterium sp. J223]UUX96467.1 GMC family oxidoreductase N-terminal domain-containing protein [Aquabacterium sp. J223]